VRALELAGVALAAYLAGLLTAALARRLRYRRGQKVPTTGGVRTFVRVFPFRPSPIPLWWCRHFHKRAHVAYSPASPRARRCRWCGYIHDLLTDEQIEQLRSR